MTVHAAWSTLNAQIIVANVVIWTAYSILMAFAAQEERVPKLSLVLGTEALKLVFATIYHLYVDGSENLPATGKGRLFRLLEGKGAAYLMPPAAIYMLNNYLTFVNLTIFDPATYRVLTCMRIVTTGVLMQLAFQTRLGTKKWSALMLLVVGCVVGKVGGGQLPDVGAVTALSWLALLIQCLCSSCGSVYFQWVLQRINHVGTWEKNTFLYFFGVVFNLAYTALVVQASPFPPQAREALLDNWVIGATVVLGAAGGLAVGLLLKYLDSALKEITNGFEIFTVALVQWPVMGIPLRPTLVISIGLVTAALRLYSSQAVVTRGRTLAPMSLQPKR